MLLELRRRSTMKLEPTSITALNSAELPKYHGLATVPDAQTLLELQVHFRIQSAQKQNGWISYQNLKAAAADLAAARAINAGSDDVAGSITLDGLCRNSGFLDDKFVHIVQLQKISTERQCAVAHSKGESGLDNINKLAAHHHSIEHPNMSKLGNIESCEDERSYLSSSQ